MTDEANNNVKVNDALTTSDEANPEQIDASESVRMDPSIVEGNKVIEKLEFHPEPVEEELPHVVPPYTILFGRRIETDVYNVIFGILAGITLAEVAIAAIFDASFILRTPLLVGLSISKALMVVAFYMHLREDSRVFAAAIIIPALISLVCTLFLLGVPYSSYTVAP